jgi:5'-deoxynucleotidase YfbR-like HD superfamily hydrolase
VLHRQTVGEHSARVACIVVEIFGMPRAEVLYYALMHDAGEMWSGDVPYSAKRENHSYRDSVNESERLGLKMLGVNMPQLTELEFTQVKIADLLEMYESGGVEHKMGNQFAEVVVRDTVSAALKLAAQHELSNKVEIWLSHNDSK